MSKAVSIQEPPTQAPQVQAPYVQEPYRLLFPLGLIGLGLGLGLWLPALWLKPAYPSVGHVGLQIQGYLLSFVLGFLMTMLPKALALPPWSRLNVISVAILLTGHMVAALAGSLRLMTVLHAAIGIAFLVGIGTRFKHRRQNPPAAFRLIAVAWACDAVGIALRGLALATGIFTDRQAEVMALASLLQIQAFPLLLIGGVGSFLLPRLFAGYIVTPAMIRSAGPSNSPRVERALLWATAAAMVAGCIVEAFVSVRWGYACRFLAMALVLFGRIGLHRLRFKTPPYLQGAQWGLWCTALGLVLPVFDPRHKLAYEHLIFIGGYGWLTLSVAARVLASHGGVPELLQAHGGPRSWLGAGSWARAVALALLLGMAARIGTDLAGDMSVGGGIYRWGYSLAVLAVGLAFAIWSLRFLPALGRYPQGRR